MRTPIATGRRDLELLDVMRGLGFLMVVLTHTLGYDGHMRAQILPQVPPVVDMFFLISGFVAGYGNDARLHSGARSVGQVIIRRIIRLFPLIVLGTLLGAVPFFLRLVVWHDTARIVPGLVVFLRGIFLIPTPRFTLGITGLPDAFPFDVPLWFIFFDTLGYLLYVFFLRFLSLRWLLLIAAISVIGLWKLALSRNTLNPGAWYPDLLPVAPRALFDFTFGYILFRLYRPGFWKSGPAAPVLPFIVFLAVLFIPLPESSPYSGAFQAVVATMVMPALLIAVVHIPAGPRMAAIASWSGRLSLAVYVIHFPIISAMDEMSWRRNSLVHHTHMLAALEGLVVLIASFLATVYFDEPIRARLMARFQPRRALASKQSQAA
jgi:peptidoglycan/LPS O-acetylase OafA/YrhL